MVSMYHSEALASTPHGDVKEHEYGPNVKALVNYTLGGGEDDEVFTPLFTYYAFRYVKVMGFPGVPTSKALQCHMAHTDFATSSQVSFGANDLLNRIQRATRMAALSNYYS